MFVGADLSAIFSRMNSVPQFLPYSLGDSHRACRSEGATAFGVPFFASGEAAPTAFPNELILWG